MRSKWSTLAARTCRSGSFSRILPGSHSMEIAILRPGLPFPEHLRAYLSAKPDSSSKLSGSFPLIRLCSESRSFLPDLNFRLSTGRAGAASPKAGRQAAWFSPPCAFFMESRSVPVPDTRKSRLPAPAGRAFPSTKRKRCDRSHTAFGNTFFAFLRPPGTGAYRPSRKASSRSMASFSSSSGRT